MVVSKRAAAIYSLFATLNCTQQLAKDKIIKKFITGNIVKASETFPK